MNDLTWKVISRRNTKSVWSYMKNKMCNSRLSHVLHNFRNNSFFLDFDSSFSFFKNIQFSFYLRFDSDCSFLQLNILRIAIFHSESLSFCNSSENEKLFLISPKVKSNVCMCCANSIRKLCETVYLNFGFNQYDENESVSLNSIQFNSILIFIHIQRKSFIGILISSEADTNYVANIFPSFHKHIKLAHKLQFILVSHIFNW